MSKNAQRMITGASLLGGLSLMTLVFSIQRDPLAWTSADSAAATPMTVASPTPIPRPLPTSGPPPADPLASKASPIPLIEVPPVRITASASKSGPNERRERGAAEACSERHEAGPMNPGPRRGREQC